LLQPTYARLLLRYFSFWSFFLSQIYLFLSKIARTFFSKNNIKAREIIRVMTKSHVKPSRSFQLRAPSSTKVETASDPQMKVGCWGGWCMVGMPYND